MLSTPTRCRRCDRPRARGFADCEEHSQKLRQEDSVPTPDDFEVDEDEDFDEPEPYDDYDGYEADRAADRYEAWLFREPY